MSDKTVEHHDNCDSVGLGPDLEPSTKPCNCHVKGSLGTAVSEVMGFVSAYDIACRTGAYVFEKQRALKAAITALVEQRDQAVKELESRNKDSIESMEMIVDQLECAANERDANGEQYFVANKIANELRIERDQLKARVERLEGVLASTLRHARRYHVCNDGPFDEADKALAGLPPESDPVI